MVRLLQQQTLVGGEPGAQNDAFDNVYTAITAAFAATRRQLHDHAEKEREFELRRPAPAWLKLSCPPLARFRAKARASLSRPGDAAFAFALG